MLIDIAFGSNIRDTKLKTKQLKSKELFKLLSKPDVRQQKDGPYFITAKFNKPIREAVHIEHYCAATIDIDNTTLDIQDIHNSLKKYRHCIYTTHNHTRILKNKKTGKRVKKGKRYRVVVIYKFPLNTHDHKLATTYLSSLIHDGNIDSSSGDTARAMYLPSCPAKKVEQFRFVENKVKKRFRLTPSMSFKAGELLQTDTSENGGRFDREEETIHGERNVQLSKYAGQLITQGKSKKQVRMAMQGYNVESVKPPLAASEVAGIAESVFNTHKKKNNDGGWGFDKLKEDIDKQKSSQVREDIEKHLSRIAKSKDKLSKIQFTQLITLLDDRTRFGKKTLRETYRDITGETAVEEKKKKEAAKEKELNSENLKEEFKEYCYVLGHDKVYNHKKNLAAKPQAFNTAYSKFADKGAALASFIEFDLVKVVDRLEYNPAKKRYYRRDHVNYVNTYKPVKLKPKKGDITPFLDHIEYMIPDEYEREIFLNYLAFQFQHPGKKLPWMLIFKSVKGIGKSMVEKYVLTPLLGKRNVKKPASDIIKSDFNGWVLNAQFQIFHELKFGDTRNERVLLTEKLKTLITEDTVSAHTKGLDPYEVINVTNFLGFTNHDDALILTRDERRFCFIKSTVEPKEIKYYEKLGDWLEIKKNKKAMLYYFQNKDISELNVARAPYTEYTETIKESSERWPDSIIYAALADKKHVFNTDGAMPWSVIVEHITTESHGRDAMIVENLKSENGSYAYRLRNALVSLGFKKWLKPTKLKNPKVDHRLRIGPKGHRKLQSVWIAPAFVQKYSKYSAKEIRKVFKNQNLSSDID